MRKLDLTIFDDILEFRRNYTLYKDSIGLPEDVNLKIGKWVSAYNKGILTSTELSNLISDIIVSFIDYLDIEIRRE